MHIHILGVCGTFMGGIALLARQAGHRVTGSDTNVYPPMSTQLEEQGIGLMEGYHAKHLQPAPDVVVIGNALSRGNPAVEYVLDNNIPYTSGPQWLADYFLRDRWVLAVAGTHGKTTTSSILAWILEYAGLTPGFLIGGVPSNFGISARSGNAPFFVVEADEYDTAFFDKRSKFIHYKARTLVLNNLEFDHADIFPDLDAIKRQFHHLVRTVPGNGLIVHNQDEPALKEVLAQGCWTPLESFGESANATWSAQAIKKDMSQFQLLLHGEEQGVVQWSLLGRHNMQNALAALAAARHVGVPTQIGMEALASFQGVRRRMELRGVVGGVRLYDDFAHHPTAIRTTLEGLRNSVGNERIIVLFEPRSNTMKMGVHKDELADSLHMADSVYFLAPTDLSWDIVSVVNQLNEGFNCTSVDQIVRQVKSRVKSGDHILILSNGGFGGIHEKLLQALEERIAVPVV